MNEFERVRRSILINSGKPSYAIFTDDTRVNFELENTPMSNFEGLGTPLTLNGVLYEKNLLKGIYFGNSYGQVASIGDYVLSYYTSMTSATLPEGLTSIGNYAFYRSNFLSLVICLPTIPPSLGYSAFYNTHPNLSIKVPAQSVDAYKAATNWNSYANKISAI